MVDNIGTVRKIIRSDRTISIPHTTAEDFDVFQFRTRNGIEKAMKILLLAGRQKIDRRSILIIKKNTDIFTLIGSKSINFINREKTRQRLAGKLDMSVKGISDGCG